MLITVLINQMAISLGTETGMSDANIQGMLVEKKRMPETLTVATINLVTNPASTTINEGNKISVIPREMALAASKLSGTCNSHVKG